MLIVGAGEAGARTAIALREAGWSGSLTIVGEEDHPPYERPPLSKATMLAIDEPAPATILTAERARQLDISLILGRRVQRINRVGHRVTLSDGRELDYRRMLLATGASRRTLAVSGAGPENVLYLRNFSDALALRARWCVGGHLVLIGGGFIGLELAASARARGIEVTLLEGASRILQRGVPDAAAAVIASRHRRAGVRIVTGARIASVESRADIHTVVLEDGSRIDADGIVAGIGASPATELAASSGLAIDNGVAVDATLLTSDPDIFAAGDCCSFPHPLYDNRRIRLEAWRNAQDQAEVVAQNMLGARRSYDAVPWFWSDQYELTLQTTGLAEGTLRLVTRRTGDDATLWFHLDAEGRLLSATGVGPLSDIARDMRVAEMMIGARCHPSPDVLADPTMKLRALLKSAG